MRVKFIKLSVKTFKLIVITTWSVAMNNFLIKNHLLGGNIFKNSKSGAGKMIRGQRYLSQIPTTWLQAQGMNPWGLEEENQPPQVVPRPTHACHNVYMLPLTITIRNYPSHLVLDETLMEISLSQVRNCHMTFYVTYYFYLYMST